MNAIGSYCLLYGYYFLNNMLRHLLYLQNVSFTQTDTYVILYLRFCRNNREL